MYKLLREDLSRLGVQLCWFLWPIIEWYIRHVSTASLPSIYTKSDYRSTLCESSVKNWQGIWQCRWTKSQHMCTSRKLYWVTIDWYVNWLSTNISAEITYSKHDLSWLYRCFFSYGLVDHAWAPYVWVIDEVWGQDGWILAKFFFCVFRLGP